MQLGRAWQFCQLFQAMSRSEIWKLTTRSLLSLWKKESQTTNTQPAVWRITSRNPFANAWHYDEAGSWRTAAKPYLSHLGENHPEAATSLGGLAWVVHASWKRTPLGRALSICQAAFEANQTNTGTGLTK